MSKKEKLQKNPVRPLSPPAVSETFSTFRIRIILLFDENEYRLKGPGVSSMAKKEVACAQDLAMWIKSYFFDPNYNSCFFAIVMKIMR
jgi:hypothetical protein